MMASLPKPKLELPSFITGNTSSIFETTIKGCEKQLWPGVPASGRQIVYDNAEKNFTPPTISSFDAYTDEGVKKLKENVDSLYHEALKTGYFDDWKKEKLKLKNAIKSAKLKHKLQTEFPAECMMPFYCDACDRGFMSDGEYQSHCKEHVQCGKKGCCFVGHPKVVQVHQRMQHVAGLAFKIMNVKTKQDIDNWRKERKRKFPTAANIKAKKEIEAERRARGNTLKTKEFGKFKNKKKKCRSHNKKSNRVIEQPRIKKIKPHVELNLFESSDSDEETVSCHGIPKFRGLSLLSASSDDYSQSENSEDENSPVDEIDKADDYNNYNEDVDVASKEEIHVTVVKEEESVKDDLVIVENVVPAATEAPMIKQTDVARENFQAVEDPMAILLQSQSDSDNSEAPDEMPITRTACSTTIDACEIGGALGSLMDTYSMSSSDDEDDCSNVSYNKPIPVKSQKKIVKPMDPKKLWNPYLHKNKIDNPQYSLLEKILAKEIRKERNIMLQCVTYIVKKNFFGIGQDP